MRGILVVVVLGLMSAALLGCGGEEIILPEVASSTVTPPAAVSDGNRESVGQVSSVGEEDKRSSGDDKVGKMAWDQVEDDGESSDRDGSGHWRGMGAGGSKADLPMVVHGRSADGPDADGGYSMGGGHRDGMGPDGYRGWVGQWSVARKGPVSLGGVCGVGLLSVSATGRVEAMPDLAVLTVSVMVEGETVVAAREGAALVLERAVIAFLDNGVVERDLTTSRFRVQPLYDYLDSGRVVRGYQVSHGLMAEYRDMEEVGSLVDAVLMAGGDELFFDGVSFRHADSDVLTDEARDLAVAELLRRAERLASAVGRELGPVLTLNDGYASSYSFKSDLYAVSALESSWSRSATRLMVGDGAVEVSVNGEFALLPEDGSAMCGRVKPGF